MTDAPLFSVVICTYKRYDFLPKAIASVQRQTIAPNTFDIWVMDNSPASPERAASRKAHENQPNLHYIELDTPGLSHARNQAAAMAAGKYLVFLDDDAEAAPDWLQRYRDALQQFGAQQIGGLGGPVDPAFAIPRPIWLSDKLLPYLSAYDDGPVAVELPPGHGPIGANALFERDSILRGGGFATGLGRQGENSLLSGEESELCARIRVLGKKFFYLPGPRVRHHIPADRLTQAWFRRRAAWQAMTVQINNPLSADQALQLWPVIIEYVRKVPRDHIPFMGLLWDTDDPELFAQQITCIQFHTRILISQGAYPPEMTRSR